MGKKERLLCRGFAQSQFWKEVLKPYIEKKIEQYSAITAIDKKNVELSYHKAHAKREIYVGLKNIIEKEWPDKVDLDEHNT